MMIKTISFFIIFSCIPTLALSSSSDKDWKIIAFEDGISVSSLKAPSQSNGVIPFKASGTIDASIIDVLNLLKNHRLKPNWSPKLKSITIHKKLNDNEYIFSEYYKTPWPAFDREFLMHGKITYHKNSTITLNASSLSQDHPNYKKYADNSHIQAHVTYINLTLNSADKTSTKLDFEFHGDMKGWMPVWLMNLIQKKWPLRFIQGVRKQLKLNNTNSIAKN